jgi:hypothetical protein
VSQRVAESRDTHHPSRFAIRRLRASSTHQPLGIVDFLLEAELYGPSSKELYDQFVVHTVDVSTGAKPPLITKGNHHN